MARRTYTDTQRAEALQLYLEHGPAEAARRTGIAEGTLKSWASRNGVAPVATEQRSARVAGAQLSLADRKLQLASDLLDDAQRLRTQLFAATVERKALVVPQGAGAGSVVEIVDVELDQPHYSDQRQIMTSIAIAVDKVQILTGQATEITEHRQVDAVDDELRRLTAELGQRVTQPA
jgi:transposase-like protein